MTNSCILCKHGCMLPSVNVRRGFPFFCGRMQGQKKGQGAGQWEQDCNQCERRSVFSLFKPACLSFHSSVPSVTKGDNSAPALTPVPHLVRVALLWPLGLVLRGAEMVMTCKQINASELGRALQEACWNPTRSSRFAAVDWNGNCL